MAHDRVGRQLEQVFEEERRHLISGDLARLAPLARRKQRLLAALADSNAPQPTLARLAALSERNQTLLGAAQEGLLSVQARLADLARGAPVGTYSRSGEKSEYARPVRTLHRRA